MFSTQVWLFLRSFTYSAPLIVVIVGSSPVRGCFCVPWPRRHYRSYVCIPWPRRHYRPCFCVPWPRRHYWMVTEIGLVPGLCQTVPWPRRHYRQCVYRDLGDIIDRVSVYRDPGDTIEWLLIGLVTSPVPDRVSVYRDLGDICRP
jgi:hypothetical protein